MSWHQGPIICNCVIGFQLQTRLIPAAGHNLPTEAPWRWRCCCPASQWHQPPCGPGEGLDMAIIGGALYAWAGSFCLTNWWLFKIGCWILWCNQPEFGEDFLKKWWLFKIGCWISMNKWFNQPEFGEDCLNWSLFSCFEINIYPWSRVWWGNMLNSGTKPDVTRHCSMWVKTYFNYGQLRTTWSFSLRHSVFSDLGYSYPKEKSALRRFLELVIGTVWGIWIWWITLLPQIAFDHRPGGYACHLSSENWVIAAGVSGHLQLPFVIDWWQS